MAVGLFLCSCGKKESEQTQAASSQDETMLVDSIDQDIQNSAKELSQQADSLTNDVDSLLQGI